MSKYEPIRVMIDFKRELFSSIPYENRFTDGTLSDFVAEAIREKLLRMGVE